MNEDGYKIINVGDGSDSAFGDIVIAKANPILNNGFSTFFTTHECRETELFFFPKNNETILNQILQIARGGGVWYPNDDDFVEGSVLYENTNKRTKIYRHLSFFDEDYEGDLNSGKDVCLIPDMHYKISTLNSQFYKGFWFQEYGSFRSYVESLAEGDDVDNFWGWLFGRQDLNGLSPWQLPDEYYSEYERFLDACSSSDNNDY